MRSIASLALACTLVARPGVALQEPEPRPVRTVPPSSLPTPVVRAAASDLRVEHTPPACLPTDTLPLLVASVSPAARFARAYVLFRASDAHAPYSWVPMDGDARALRANLPRPLAGTHAVAYAIEAVDRSGRATRTPMTTVSFSSSCAERGSAVSGGVTVGATELAQPAVPSGFDRADVAWVVTAGGSVLARDAAVAAAGPVPAPTPVVSRKRGGIPTGVLIAGGAVLAGAGVAVAASGSKGGGGSSPPPQASSTPVSTPTPTPPSTSFRFIEADVNWSGPGNLQVTLVASSGAAAGTNVAHSGCGTSGTRVDRWILQGSALVPGTYTPRVSAFACSGEPVQPITGALSVVFEGGVRCTRFFTLSPGESQAYTDCALNE